MSAQATSTDILPAIREELGFAWHTVRCAFYVSWWRVKHYIWSDVRLNKGAKAAGAISAGVLFLDVALFLFHHQMAYWLGGLAVVVLFPTAGVLTLHRIEEWARKGRESLFVQHAEEVADEMVKLGQSPLEGKDAALTDFISKLLKKIVQEFGEKINNTPNVMLPGPDDKLTIVYVNEQAKYDPNLRIDLGAGAAGFSYQETATVYIPRIKYAHGIIVRPRANGNREIRYGLKPRLYFPISKEYENYQSILSLPICVNGGKYAVLNVDSTRPDAFKIGDIDLLKAYAHLIGAGASLCACRDPKH